MPQTGSAISMAREWTLDTLRTSERVNKIILATKNALMITTNPSGARATYTILVRQSVRVYECLSCGELGVTYRRPAGHTIGGTRAVF